MSKVVPLRTAAMTRQQTLAGETAAQHHAGPSEHWSELMAHAQDGDQHAYRTLLHEITPYLRSLARRHLGAGGEIEDAVQEILLTVHCIRHTYEHRRPFKPWLKTIASRRLIDMLRARVRRLRHETEADADGADTAPDADEQPDRFAARVHTAREVQRAVDALPPRQREAVALLRLKELSLDEAAGVSRHSAGALKVACHRALKSLHALLHDKMLRDRNRP